MIRTTAIFSAILAVSYGFIQEFPDANNNNWRVVGGENAEKGEFPFIISLRVGIAQSHNCGGSLISRNWVVTAAHCVAGSTNPDYYKIIAGTNQLNTGGEVREVERVIIHENYDSRLIENDIAILKLKEPFPESDLIEPIGRFCVNVDMSLDCILAGWGRTSYPNGGIPNDLQRLKMSTITHADCVDKMSSINNPIFRTEVCGLTISGEGACHGDSGGPLLWRDDIGKPWLVGIVSWGSPCARGLPDVYTRVSSYCEWIDEHTKDCVDT